MESGGAEFEGVVTGLRWWRRSLGLDWVWRFERGECCVH